MPTASEDLGSPRDVIRQWLSRTNDGDKSLVAGKRQEHGMDEDRRGKYQHPADHGLETRKAHQQETGCSLGQRRKTKAKMLLTDAGALANTFENEKHTEDFWKRLDDVTRADWCI